MLLYLLASDDDDAILLRTFLDLVMAKYSGVTTDDVYTFLDKLDRNHQILQKRAGTASSADPDPLDLFNPPQVPWEANPDVTQGPKAPICKTRTFHSINAGYVRIPR